MQSQSLPVIAEGRKLEFEDRTCDEYKYKLLLRQGHKEAGALLWASQRTRPDVAQLLVRSVLCWSRTPAKC